MNFKNNFNLKTTVKGQKSDAIDCFIKIWNSEQSSSIVGYVREQIICMESAEL